MVAPLLVAAGSLFVKALTNPIIAGTAASWIASKFGLADSTVEAVSNFINGLKPDDQVKLKELEYDFQKFLLSNGIQLDLAQIDVNKEEAKSENIFIAGWRPFVGWVGGVGFAYLAVVEPVGRFVAAVIFGYTGAFPVIDTGLLVTVLMGLLGMSGLRTYEKKQDVNKNR